MNEKQALRLIYTVSALVLVAVVVLFNLPKNEEVPELVQKLPTFNAWINGTCTILLSVSWWMIRARRIEWHKRLNIAAFCLSSLFLISYVIFHAFGVETRFPADNPLRPYYLTILISHIILAAVVLPMVLLSFYRGLTGQIEAHKRITRWSMPIWLYVTTTGVVVYLMISPYYSF
jgi:putative membrane protein